jgi:hypothetical protein
LLRAGGYQVHRTERTPRAQFLVEARPYLDRRAAMTPQTVEELSERYREPVFGVIPVWDVVEMLSHVIDVMDPDLMNVSQEVHVLQVLEAMASEGVDDETLFLAGVLHDLGKVLILVGEDPANLFGTTLLIDEGEPGGGLDDSVLQWGADEFAYARFAGRVPDHVAWLIRYHSIVPDECVHLMDDRDRDYFERYLKDFSRWDRDAKSFHRVPRTRMRDYRDLVEAALPDPIPF